MHLVGNTSELIAMKSIWLNQMTNGCYCCCFQWVEESFTNFEKGINWRSYVVCDVAYNNVNNWLWTPFIERGEANRIYIEVKFSMRDCSLFPGTALSCKETFSLLYYEFDAATREPPPWEPDSYKLIDRIAADEGRFTSSNEVTFSQKYYDLLFIKDFIIILDIFLMIFPRFFRDF